MTHGAAQASYHSRDMLPGRTHAHSGRRVAKNENREKEYPGGPQELENDSEWKDTTHPNQKGSQEFQNKKTGEKIRYDYGKPGKPGHEGKDHYHRLKPKSGTNKCNPCAFRSATSLPNH